MSSATEQDMHFKKVGCAQVLFGLDCLKPNIEDFALMCFRPGCCMPALTHARDF